MENQTSGIHVEVRVANLAGALMIFIGGWLIGLSIPVQRPLLMAFGFAALYITLLYWRKD